MSFLSFLNSFFSKKTKNNSLEGTTSNNERIKNFMDVIDKTSKKHDVYAIIIKRKKHSITLALANKVTREIYPKYKSKEWNYLIQEMMNLIMDEIKNNEGENDGEISQFNIDECFKNVLRNL